MIKSFQSIKTKFFLDEMFLILIAKNNDQNS
jgi:hypothetical protein